MTWRLIIIAVLIVLLIPTMALLRKQYALADIGRVVLLPEDCSVESGMVEISNDEIAKLVALDAQFYIGMAAVDPRRPDAVQELERAFAELGLAGLAVNTARLKNIVILILLLANAFLLVLLFSRRAEENAAHERSVAQLTALLSADGIAFDSALLDGLLAKGLCTAAAVEALGLRRETLTAREAADRHLSAILCLDLFADEEAIEADEPTANASAFLISPDGLAVTNYHSIDGAISGRATLITGEACAIERVIYYDADIDLAVIRIARTTAEGETVPRFHAIALAGAKEVRMGDTVYALGNPLGLGLAMSRGIVSATAHKADLSTLPCIVSDATISRGSSGGALLNEYGRAVAVTTGAYVYGNNMYLCVPLDPVLEADLTGEGMTLQEVLDAVTAAREAAAAAAEADESR